MSSFAHYTCELVQQLQQAQQQQTTSNAPLESFSVPFPLPPYPVQRSVAASIRTACKIGNGAVCVVESPTGTGKSQALLNSVLSHIADNHQHQRSAHSAAVTATGSSVSSPLLAERPSSPATSHSALRRNRTNEESQGQRQQQGESNLVLQQQQRSITSSSKVDEDDAEEENQHDDDDSANDKARALLDRVNNFIRKQEQLSKALKKRRRAAAAATNGGENDADDDTAFLITAAAELDDDTAVSRARRFKSEFDSTSSSSSRSSSAVTARQEDDDEAEIDDSAFADAFERLATSTRPKVIFTSRTHSQLAQIIDEVQKGPFRFPTVSEQKQQQPQQQQQNCVFPVRYLHVGSRQQLCINDSIRAEAAQRGGGNERLNELCKEAVSAYRTSLRESRKKATTASRRRTKNDDEEIDDDGGGAKKRHSTTEDAKKLLNRTVAAALASVGNNAAVDIEDIADSSAGGCCEFANQQNIQHLLRRMMVQPRSMNELRELGRQLKACPFFATRYAVHFSQLLLMPYTYLVDKRMRSQLLGGGLNVGDGVGAGQDQQQHRKFDKNKKKNESKKGAAAVVGDEAAAANSARSAASSLPWQFLISRDVLAGGSDASSVGDDKNTHSNNGDESTALLRGAIVVVDEAHNLAESAAAACTASIRTDSLDSAVRTLHAYMTHFESRLLAVTKQRLREISFALEKWRNFLMLYGQQQQDQQQQDQQQQAAATTAVLGTMTLTRFTFDSDTANIEFPRCVDFLENNDTLTRIGFFGERHFAKLYQQQIQQSSSSSVAAATSAGNDTTKKQLQEYAAMSRAQQQQHNRQLIAEMEQREQMQVALAKEAAQFVSPVKALRGVHRVLELFGRSADESSVVAILQENDDGNATTSSSSSSSSLRTLQILSLSPAQAVEPLTRQAHATILAGGTLQPFPLLKMELFPSYGNLCSTVAARQQQQQAHSVPHFPPPLIAEAFTHVVDPNRFLLFPLSRGPDNQTLRFTKATSDQRPQMLHSVCLTLLNLSRTVPRGLVVFLPSFAMEEAFFEALDKSGLRPQIEQLKPIFREGHPAPLAAATSATAISTRRTAKKLSGEELFSEYSAHIERCKQQQQQQNSQHQLSQGAMLVSVMGGKLSEGINFSDDLGRCVVVVGMPYPNLGDAKLQLKLESLKVGGSGGNSNSNNSNNAEDWSKRYYDALCMRSVNQSIGRCIRHVNDYAVVLLLDERFNDVKVARQLPKWMQPRLMLNGTFGTVFKSVGEFFRGMQNQS